MDRNFSRFNNKGSKKLYIQNYYLVSAPSWQKIREWQSFLFPAWNSHEGKKVLQVDARVVPMKTDLSQYAFLNF